MFPIDIRIEELQKDELKELAVLLTNAFESNPAYALIFTKKDKLREGLLWLFKSNLFLLNQRMIVTKVVKEKDSGEIVGVFSLIPPGGVKIKLTDYLKIGLPKFILKFGFRTLNKILKLDSFNKEILDNAIGTNKYYYLSMVVVNKNYQGMGIGSYMIKNCLKELKSVDKECYLLGLTTQLPENLAFYTRLGFQKLNEGEVQFMQHRYYNYNMKLDL